MRELTLAQPCLGIIAQQRAHDPGIVARLGGACGDFAGDLVEHLADFPMPLGRSHGDEARTHLRGCLGQERSELGRRDVGAPHHALGERAVRPRTGDEFAARRRGENSRRIGRNVALHIGIAAADQHFGDGFSERAPPRDREQVGLALRCGDVDEVRLREPRRLHEHGAGDRDRIVAREAPQHLFRRVRDRPEPTAEFRQRPRLDAVDQAAHHVVEQRDLLAGKAIGGAEEQVGDAPQGLRATFRRTALDCVLEVDDQGRARGHAVSVRPAGGSRAVAKIGFSREQLVWRPNLAPASNRPISARRMPPSRRRAVRRP